MAAPSATPTRSEPQASAGAAGTPRGHRTGRTLRRVDDRCGALSGSQRPVLGETFVIGASLGCDTFGMSNGPYKSSVLYQLAAHETPNTTQPTHADVGIEGLVAESDEWFELRHTVRWAMFTRIDLENRWREVMGLVGSVAEQTMLVTVTEVEVDYLRRAIAGGDLPDGMTLAQRWFSEQECQSLIAVGHRLMNIVMRAMLLRDDIRTDALDLSRFGDFIDERDCDERAGWLNLKASSAIALGQVATAHNDEPLQAMCEAVQGLAESDAWTYLEEQRGEDHHRWRRESSHLAGVNSRPLALDPTAVRTFGGPPEDYTDADGMEEFVAEIAHNAALELVDTMAVIRQAFYRGAQALTGGAIGFQTT